MRLNGLDGVGALHSWSQQNVWPTAGRSKTVFAGIMKFELNQSTLRLMRFLNKYVKHDVVE